MAVQLLGVREGALDGLLAAAVSPCPYGLAVGVGSLAGVLPDMAGDQPGRVGARCAGGDERTVPQTAGSLLWCR